MATGTSNLMITPNSNGCSITIAASPLQKHSEYAPAVPCCDEFVTDFQEWHRMRYV